MKQPIIEKLDGKAATKDGVFEFAPEEFDATTAMKKGLPDWRKEAW